MQRITLDNFRVFGTEASFELAPVTVLTGKNNSGKSSLIKAFLVLADYLEQEDQTVLRLDGRRAGKHKIGTFAQLANWRKENSGNSVKLGYAKGQYEFEYEFDLEENAAAATASLKKFNMRLTPLGLELVLSRNARLGGYYELSVNQQFIDYVTDEQGREVTRAYLTSVGDDNRLAWLKAELEEVTGALNISMGSWVKEAQGQNWEKNPHSSDFMELTSKKQKLEAQIKGIEQFAKRQIKALPYRPQIQLAAIDGGTPTLSRIVQHGLLKYIEEDNIRARKQFKFGKGGERRVLVDFIQRMGHLMQFQVEHLGPNRTYQARLMGPQDGEIGRVAAEYVRYNVAKGQKAQEFLTKWLKRFEVGTAVKIESTEALAFRVFVKQDGVDISLADLGFGAGQLLCILLIIATTIHRREVGVKERFLSFQHSIVLLIEEPEANLHPYLQSMLAQMFVETARSFGLQMLIESHSEYLIRKLQILVAKAECNSEDIAIYYLDQINSQVLVRKIGILQDGVLSEAFGPKFFDEASSEVMELFRIQKQINPKN